MPLSIPILAGAHIHLETLAESHREALRAAADDERIWRHTITIARGPGFDEWFDEALDQHAAGQRVPFTVRRLEDNAVIGSTSYLDVVLKHKRLEIGSTWYRPELWGTAINPECKLLLFAHAFDVLGVNRVALITDRMNERSQAAIAKLGAVREGVLRAHMVVQAGRVRDSVMFSVMASEWPAVRERLMARLASGVPARRDCAR